MKTYVLALGMGLSLSGCGLFSFAPSVDARIANNLDETTESLSFIAACIELGSCAGKAQIGTVDDRYVSAYAKTGVALTIAEGTEVAGDRDQQAKDLLLEEITECRDAVKRQYDAHRRFNSLQNAGLAAPTVVTCQLAADGARALSRL